MSVLISNPHNLDQRGVAKLPRPNEYTPCTKALLPINQPSRQWPVMTPPAGCPHYFPGPLGESAPFRQSSKLPHQTFYVAYQTGPFAQSCVPICGHPVLLPAQCPVLQRSPKVAQQQFKLPSIYWCLDAATVPGARDKIWKMRVLNVREEMKSVELKGTSRILCSSSSFSKEKIGPWRLNDPL